jgi:hypothetical protein
MRRSRTIIVTPRAKQMSQWGAHPLFEGRIPPQARGLADVWAGSPAMTALSFSGSRFQELRRQFGRSDVVEEQ